MTNGWERTILRSTALIFHNPASDGSSSYTASWETCPSVAMPSDLIFQSVCFRVCLDQILVLTLQ